MQYPDAFISACENNDYELVSQYIDEGLDISDAGFLFEKRLEDSSFHIAQLLVDKGLDPNYYLYLLSEWISLDLEEYYILWVGLDQPYPPMDRSKFLVNIGSELNSVDHRNKTALDYLSDSRMPQLEFRQYVIDRGGKLASCLDKDEILFSSRFRIIFSLYDLNDIKRYVEYKKLKNQRILSGEAVEAFTKVVLRDPSITRYPHMLNLDKVDYLMQTFKPDIHVTYELYALEIVNGQDEAFRVVMENAVKIFLHYNLNLNFNYVYQERTSLDILNEHEFFDLAKLVRLQGGKTFAELQ